MRRTRYELKEAQRRAEQLEGYLIALGNLDEVIKIIRRSADREEARVKIAAYKFTRREAESYGHSHPQRGAPDQRLVPHQRPAGRSHPRTAPVSTDRPRAREDHRRIRRTAEEDRGLERHSFQGSARAHDHQEGAQRDQGQARQPAPYADRARRGRDRDRGPHRQRGCDHHHYA